MAYQYLIAVSLPHHKPHIPHIREYYLFESDNGFFYSKTNSKKFKSIKSAVMYAKDNRLQNFNYCFGLAEASTYVLGPKGGKYSIYSGKLLK
jgi:hypothetical protein